MKRVYQTCTCILTMLAGCRPSPPKEVPSFLPGIYVSQSENEFCRITDTFVIRRIRLEGDHYRVIRKSSFQRIRQGGNMPVEYQSEQWEAVFEEPDKVLRGTEKGKELRYVPGENRVYNAETGYEKVE